MVTYDLTDGFDIEVDVTPFLDNVTADDGTGVDGYFCNADGVKLNEIEIKQLSVRGTQLEVCVVPDEKTMATGAFSIDKILAFDWVRTDGNAVVRQPAIVDGKPAGNGLTELQCDDIGCQFVSLLKVRMKEEKCW